MAEFFAGGHLRFLDGKWRDDNGDVVEIAPVVRGRWGIDEFGRYCTVCNEYALDYESGEDMQLAPYLTPYCPQCGAKMEG